MKTILNVLIFIGVFQIDLQAQTQNHFWINEEDTFNVIQGDSLEVAGKVNQFLFDRLHDGYVFCRLDSISSTVKGHFYFFHFGEKFKWKIRSLILDSGFLKSPSKNKIRLLFQDHLDSGYPFASIRLAGMEQYENHLVTDLYIKRNFYIEYDTLEQLNPDSGVKDKFLWKALNMDPGSPYSESDFRKIGETITRFHFLELNRPPDVGFSNGKAKVYLDLRKEQVNSFQGILGLQGNNNRKNVLTGYIDLEIHNLFNSAKYVSLNWNRFGELSQRLDLSYSHPYFLNSSLQLDFNMSFLKQDTSFLNTGIMLGIQQFFSPKSSIAFNYDQWISTLTDPTRSDALDYTTRWYSVAMRRFDPKVRIERKTGLIYQLESAAGSRNVGNMASDTLQKKSISLRVTGEVFGQLAVGKRSSINTTTVFKMIRNDNLFSNEFFREGGLKSFRGFNELEIYARTFLSEQIEYRQYFEKGSYLLTFASGGYLESLAGDQLIGSFGGGFTLNTGNGLFDFIFASGFSETNPFNVNEIKVHFGYSAFF